MSNGIRRILAALLMAAMLVSSMPVMAEDTVVLTMEQFEDLTETEDAAEAELPEEVTAEEPSEESAIMEMMLPELQIEAAEADMQETVEAETVSGEVTLADLVSAAAPAAQEEAEEMQLPASAEELSAALGMEISEIAEMLECTQEELLAMDAALIAEVYLRFTAAETLSLESDFQIKNGVLVKYNGSDEDVVIPDGVVRIAKNAFKGNTQLRSVVIPASVITIEDSFTIYAEGAFQNCTSLETVEFLGSGLTDIGVHTFRGCTQLEQVILPPSLVRINDRAFSGCSKLRSINLPEGLVWMGAGAFENCTALESIELPGTLSATGDAIFCGSGLETITIPGSLKVIQKLSFTNCKSLRSLVIEDGVESIEDSFAIYSEGVFQNCEELRTVEIRGSSLKSIGVHTFKGCKRLQSVVLPQSLNSIGDTAFEGCTNLASVNLPEGLVWIGKFAFDGCTSLEHIILPGTLSGTGDGIFRNSGLTEITIPGSLETIQKDSFQGCKSLKKVVIEDGVEGIEDSFAIYSEGAFQNCTALETVEILGDDFRSIGVHTFKNCTALESVRLPGSLETIGDTAFEGCTSLESVNLPEGLEWIGKFAFSGCTSLEHIILPGTLSGTGDGIFRNSGLTEITIPGSLEIIQKDSFQGCKSLKKVVIEDGVEGIEDSFAIYSEGAFQNCTALETVEILGDDFRSIGVHAFKNCTALESVHLPGSLETIADTAFEGCTSLESVNLPEGLEWIGKFAFSGCTSLEHINLPGTLSGTGDGIFRNSGLTEITIPGSLEIIQKDSFQGCKSLKKVVIEDGVEGIEDSFAIYFEGAFQNCTALETVEIQGNAFRTIGVHAFRGCTSLKNVILPGSLERISDTAFSGCTGLSKLILPASVEEFGKDVFKGCTNATIWVYADTESLVYCENNHEAQGFEYAIIGTAPMLAWKEDIRDVQLANTQSVLTLEVVSNTQWQVSAPEWLQAAPASGSGNGSIVVTVPANPGSARQGSIVVSAADCESLVLNVTQDAGCDHDYLMLNIYGADGDIIWSPEDADYTAVDAVNHSFSAYVSRKVLECAQCGAIAEEIPVNDYVIFLQPHSFHEGGDGEGGCYYCHFKEDQGCRHAEYSSEWIEYAIIDGARHYRSTVMLAEGFYACSACGYIGDGDSWGFSDWEIVEDSDASFVEPHEFVNGKCVCGYALEGIEFTSHSDGDAVDAASQLAVSWKCASYESFIVNVKLLDGEPQPGSDNEAGVVLPFAQDGNSISLLAPDADGRYIKIHVQACADGAAIAVENQIYLKVTSKNRIHLSGKETIAVGGSTTLKAAVPDGKGLNAKNLKWSTSDKTIATVSRGKVTAKKAGMVTITAAAKDGTYGTFDITVCPKAGSVAILLNGEALGKTIGVEIGETLSLQLSAAVSPGDALQDVAWKSSNTKVAKVSADGLVTILKTGKADITATAKDGSKKACKVQLQIGRMVKGIEITGKNELAAGKSATLKANITPENATNKGVAWASSDKSVVTVSSKGKITAKKVNERRSAVITATAKDGSGIVAEYEVWVYPAAKSVTIMLDGEKAGSSAAIDLGGVPSLQLDAVVGPEDAIKGVTWKSSNKKVATVDENGLVTGRKAGTVTITATAADGSKKSDKIKISVGTSVRVIEISGKTEITAGKSTTLKAKIAPTSATNKSVTWTSSDKSIATVSSKGKVTAKKLTSRQPVIITATAKDGSGVTAQHEIWVCPVAKSVSILANGAPAKEAQLAMGAKLQLAVQVLPEEAVQSVSWKSSSTKVATVDKKGLVTPVKKGSVTITATTANDKKASIRILVTDAAEHKQGFLYTVSNGEATITGYAGSGMNIRVPAEIDGHPVRCIGDRAFEGCAFSGITIPAGIVRIGDRAFEGCNPDLMIHGYAGSEAERYAFDNGIRFTALEAPVITGSFGTDSVVVDIGKTHRLDGSVRISGGSLGYITVKITDAQDKYGTVELSGVSEAALASFDAFVLDASKAPFNVPGEYTLELWARAEDSDPTSGVKLDSIPVTVRGMTGSFAQDSIALSAGQAVQLSGSVFSTGMHIAKVTVEVAGWGKTIHTRDFSADGIAGINLQDYSGYTLNPDEEPFTAAGTYTLELWASGTDGSGGVLLDEMEVVVSSVEIVDALMPLLNPTYVYNNFGKYNDSLRNHKGNDMATPKGSAVVSVRDGTVIRSYYSADAKGVGGGNIIEIQDSEFPSLTFRYMHLSDRSVVKIGQKVTAGQLIGFSGDTGSAGSYHLHLDVPISGVDNLFLNVNNSNYSMKNKVFTQDAYVFLKSLSSGDRNYASLEEMKERITYCDAGYRIAYAKENVVDQPLNINCKVPLNLQAGNTSWTTRGLISSKYPIEYVKASILNSVCEDAVEPVICYPKTCMFDMLKLNALAFSQIGLKEGAYIYRVEAIDMSGNTVTLSQPFDVSPADMEETMKKAN